jgi:hypothetical protein
MALLLLVTSGAPPASSSRFAEEEGVVVGTAITWVGGAGEGVGVNNVEGGDDSGEDSLDSITS